MEEGTIISLMVISVAFAWGARYGFNLIYKKDYKETFEKFRTDSEKDLFFKLRKIGFETFKNPEKFKQNIEGFIKNWQDYQNNIIEAYAGITRNRNFIFAFFMASALGYFLHISKIFATQEINFLGLANISFLIGLVILWAYGQEIYELNKRIAKYEKEATKRQEENKEYIKRIMEKVTKSQ